MLDVVVGALIGLVTNHIALRMLFWPREEKIVFGLRVPFTPGLFVRRRRDFSAAIGEMVEERFVNAQDLYALMQRAQGQGLVSKFMDAMGPVFGTIFSSYLQRTDPQTFITECRRVVANMRDTGLVSNTVKDKIDAMTVEEVEELIMSVVRRELNGITWAGGVLGAVIGGLRLLT